MKTALFLVNPLGTRRVELLRRHCEEAGRRYGWHVQSVVTEEGDTSRGFHRRLGEFLVTPGEKLVFAVGGDGTVRACAHDLAGTGTPLAVVPRGTANLFAHALGLPSGISAALRTGFTGASRLVDLPFAGDAPFVAMAGMGTDAAVVASASHLVKRNLGWAGYALVALPHLPGTGTEVTVAVDGGPARQFRARSVVVGNVGLLPGGFHVLPGARPDDGLLDVGILHPEGLWGWAELARRFVAGRDRPGFTHLRGSRICVEVAGLAWPVQLDGEPLGVAQRLSVTVLHRALVVKVPE